MSQNLRNYVKAIYGMDAVVQRVPADMWDAASPCEGWTARDVVAHQAGVFDAVAEIARTGEVVLPAMPDVDGDIVEFWGASRDGLIEALDRAGALNQRGAYWFGESSVDELIGFTTWDPLGHAWDLATAAGIDAPPLNDVAEASLAVIEPAADTLRGMGLIGEAVEVPSDADAMTRFLGIAGRKA